jgi:hypothetical protein
MKRRLAIAMLALILACSGISASQASEAEETGNWDFALAPFYLWAVTLEGTVSAGNLDSQVSLDTEDIFSNLESLFIVHFEAVYQKKYGFLLDVNFINIADSGPIGVGEIEVDIESTVTQAMLYYHLNRGAHSFDFMGGVLYTRVAQDVGFVGTPILIDVTESWVDPYLALRWSWDFTDRWALVAKGGLGGFGVASDLVWEGLAMVTYQPWKHAQFLLGYRTLGIDYETGAGQTRFVYDVTMTGPVVGLNFTW